jgi:hypothetical protein
METSAFVSLLVGWLYGFFFMVLGFELRALSRCLSYAPKPDGNIYMRCMTAFYYLIKYNGLLKDILSPGEMLLVFLYPDRFNFPF